MLRNLAVQPFTSWRRYYCKKVTLSSKELSSNKPKPYVTFEQLGVKPYLVKALRRQGILYPTEVQRLSIPKTLAGKHCAIQSETGSGKSLTFLIPALQDDKHRLRTIIIAPTRELGAQLHHMAKSMCPEDSGRRIVSLFSGIDNPITVDDLKKIKPNIVIGTPKRLLQFAEDDCYIFHDIHRVVFDEPDKTFSITDINQLRVRHKKLKKQIVHIHPRPGEILLSMLLDACKGRFQLICTSATINDALRGEISEMGWGDHFADIVCTVPLTIPEGISHCYAIANEADGGLNKMDLLVKLFQDSCENCALVFIHSQARIDQFTYELRNRGFTADPLYKHSAGDFSSFMEDFKQGKINFAIGTEETVRGLDFTWLQTVYTLIVPKSATEYLHMCGRVGRVGKEGRAVTIIDPSIETKELSHLQMIYKRLKVEPVRLVNYLD